MPELCPWRPHFSEAISAGSGGLGDHPGGWGKGLLFGAGVTSKEAEA